MRAINGRLVSKFHGGALARVARAGPPPMQGMKATAPWWGATGQVCAVSPVADGGVGSATGTEEVIPDQLCKPFKPVLLHAVPFRGEKRTGVTGGMPQHGRKSAISRGSRRKSHPFVTGLESAQFVLGRAASKGRA